MDMSNVAIKIEDGTFSWGIEHEKEEKLIKKKEVNQIDKKSSVKRKTTMDINYLNDSLLSDSETYEHNEIGIEDEINSVV